MNSNIGMDDSGFILKGDVEPTPMDMINGAKAGDSEAWQKLARLYCPYIYIKCRKHKLSQHDAADVVQDVFVTLIKSLPQFRKEEPHHKFRGWLHKVIQTRLADHVTNALRQTGNAESLPPSESDERLNSSGSQGDLLETTCGDRSLFDHYVRIIETEFEPRTWQAFWKVVIDERSVADVSELLGLPKNTVRKYRSRVLKRLRDEFGED